MTITFYSFFLSLLILIFQSSLPPLCARYVNAFLNGAQTYNNNILLNSSIDIGVSLIIQRTYIRWPKLSGVLVYPAEYVHFVRQTKTHSNNPEDSVNCTQNAPREFTDLKKQINEFYVDYTD